MTLGNLSHPDGLVIDGNVTSFDREYLHWSFIIIEVAAIVVIVVGDISMLMMFFTRKLLGQSTNILVFSVGIGDLVTGLLALPLAMMQKILMEPSDFLCKGYFYFAHVSKTAVGYTILLLAMERILAVLMHSFRILPPGRCLFFASLTWFFSAAYNIWSVVIYDVENVSLLADRKSAEFFLCFASSRFMYLHDIFAVLNPLVTFTFPALCSSLLFLYFLRNKREADKPGRPYKSSKSVVIFTFALLVSFVASHLPWEIATLVLNHDAPSHYSNQLVSLKVLHLISFSRGFWDIFIFGAFRHYVCKKEKALAHFREQRSLQVQRSNLAIPMSDRPLSTSLLDSDPSVSRRYSSDISRRASAFDDPHSCQVEHHLGVIQPDEESHLVLINPHVSAEDNISDSGTVPGPQLQIPVVTYAYLVPRSPCAWDSTRSLMFPPNNKVNCPDLNRRNTLTGKTAFGSCEMIPESTEVDCGVVEPGPIPKKQQNMRRKSCGDKVSHLKLRANKHAMLNKGASPSKRPGTTSSKITEDGDDVVLEPLRSLSPRQSKKFHGTQATQNIESISHRFTFAVDETVKNNNKLELADKHCFEVNGNSRDMLCTDKGNSQYMTDKGSSPYLTVKGNSLILSTSKSADAIVTPASKGLKPETRDDSRKSATLMVPSAAPRRGASCNYLTVPTSMSPFLPRSPHS